MLYRHFCFEPEKTIACSNSTTCYLFRVEEPIDNPWLSLRPMCELQGKVTESELHYKAKSYR